MPLGSIKIAPSILAGDFARMGDEAKRVEDAGADMLHVDVMDGHFVPNLTFGPQMVAALRRSCSLFLDVHIMIYRPFDWVERYLEAGADQLTFHLEATEDVEETLAFIRRCNRKAGLALCPETSVNLATKYLDQVDNLLLMTVNPGFGGQAFMSHVLDNIRFVRGVCDKLNLKEGGVTTPDEAAPFAIQVDGGINRETAEQCIEAGANVLVAGSHLFQAESMSSEIIALRHSGQVRS